MTYRRNLAIVQYYLAGRGPELIAEDAEFHDLTQPTAVVEREAIAELFNALDNVDFRTPLPK